MKRHQLCMYNTNQYEDFEDAHNSGAIYDSFVEVDVNNKHTLEALKTSVECCSNALANDSEELCAGLMIDNEFVTLECLIDA